MTMPTPPTTPAISRTGTWVTKPRPMSATARRTPISRPPSRSVLLRCRPGRRRLLPLAALLLLALPAHAAGPAFLAAVAPGDADNNLELHTARVTVGYLDANGNGHPDTQPDEMLYLDLDASGSVTYGDLR